MGGSGGKYSGISGNPGKYPHQQISRHKPQVKRNASSGWRILVGAPWKARIMGAAVGNIIATIMTTQSARNRSACRPVAGQAVGM